MLARHGIEHHILDANIEGLLHLAGQSPPSDMPSDVWTKRAFRDREDNLAALKNKGLYSNLARYTRAVKDVSRVLAKVTLSSSNVGLADFTQRGLSPVRSSDLLAAAEQPDLNPFYPYFRSRLNTLLNRKGPTVAGISLNYLSQALTAFSMIGFIRREYPGIKIVLGGGLVTSWVKRLGTMNPFTGLVDHMIAGLGEAPLMSLLGVDAAGEALPRPDYGSLPRDQYLSPGFILPYSASTGCYWNKCAFCPEQAEGNTYIPVPPQQVVTDLKALKEETGPALIHLLDNAISPAVLTALCTDSPGAPWYGFARIGPHLADADFCAALKKAGCVMLKLGIESGDQRLLDKLNKGASVEMSSVVLKNLKKAGIATYVYLLFGTPEETEVAARKTLDFTVRHSDCIDFLNLAIFNMPVCSQSQISPGIRTKKFYEGDLSLYTGFVHPSGWDRKRVRLFLEHEFRKHPAVSRIIKNDPPVFTSNHAPFFCGQATAETRHGD